MTEGGISEKSEVVLLLYPWYKEEVYRRREQMMRMTAFACTVLMLLLTTVLLAPVRVDGGWAAPLLMVTGVSLFAGIVAYLIIQQRDRHQMAKQTLIEIERALGLYEQGQYVECKTLYPAEWQTAWQSDRSASVYVGALTLLVVAAIVLRCTGRRYFRPISRALTQEAMFRTNLHYADRRTEARAPGPPFQLTRARRPRHARRGSLGLTRGTMELARSGSSKQPDRCQPPKPRVEARDSVASLMPNRPALLPHYLACMKANLVATPLNYRYAVPEIDHALELSGASILLAHAERDTDVTASQLARTLPRGVISYGSS